MYNPFEDAMRRRQQTMQADPLTPQIQQPPPMFAQQPEPGPPQMQWAQIGDPGQQQQDAGAAGAGLGSILKRFAKPKAAGPGEAKSAFDAGGGL